MLRLSTQNSTVEKNSLPKECFFGKCPKVLGNKICIAPKDKIIYDWKIYAQIAIWINVMTKANRRVNNIWPIACEFTNRRVI